MLLVPADVLRPRRPDEHFADEARAARDAGLEVALVDHDALTSGGDARRAVARVPHTDEPTTAIYRGWMLRSEQYTAFAQALAERRVTLRASPEQYRRAHELPGLVRGFAGRHAAIGMDHQRRSRRFPARLPRARPGPGRSS